MPADAGLRTVGEWAGPIATAFHDTPYGSNESDTTIGLGGAGHDMLTGGGVVDFDPEIIGIHDLQKDDITAP